jgi:hypothetical protein
LFIHKTAFGVMWVTVRRTPVPAVRQPVRGCVGVAGSGVARPLLFPLCHLNMATGNTFSWTEVRPSLAFKAICYPG